MCCFVFTTIASYELRRNELVADRDAVQSPTLSMKLEVGTSNWTFKPCSVLESFKCTYGMQDWIGRALNLSKERLKLNDW